MYFCNCAEKKLIPFIEYQLATAKCYYLDLYLSDSLKTTAGENRGLEYDREYQVVGMGSCILRNESKKTELFQYLSGVIAKHQFAEGKVGITTNTISNFSADDAVETVSCNNAASQGYRNILILENDTDENVTDVIGFVGAEKFWVSFGTGRRPFHQVA